MAEKAKQALPQCKGRVEAAVKIVLAGDVALLPDGTADVASQSNGTVTYHRVNGACDCKDFPKAPDGMCKHRLAYGIAKRASALARTQLEALDPSQPAQEPLGATIPQPGDLPHPPVATIASQFGPVRTTLSPAEK